MDLEIDGVTAGHWTDDEGGTGCTVVRFPEGTVASGEIRGGSPASREFDLLDPARAVHRLDAAVLTGGSAFGLAAADGVMAALEAEGVGFPTRAGVVPIVAALALFDLEEGRARPSAASGRAALAAATGHLPTGRVGAGAGATIAKWRGPEATRPGGLGVSVMRSGALRVAAIVAVNAAGEVDDGTTLQTVRRGGFVWPEPTGFSNTTIGVLVTNGALSKTECLLVAQGAHDGLARALVPPHMRADGDGFIAAATGGIEADVDLVRLLAVTAVEQAIRTGVDTLDV